MKNIECVPNFSEGRCEETLAAIAHAAAVPGVTLRDIHRDADHNRSVFTLTGEAAAVAEAAFRMAEVAAQRINLRTQRGQHPRIGATDVVPFVPLAGAEMADAVRLAREVGQRLADQLHIPVFLYEAAATRPECENLADVRKNAAVLTPDFGPSTAHPTAGCTAVGARKPLIAFNMLLNTPDVAVAKKIARAVRFSDGGLPYCKALGLFLADRNLAQVSMNLTDYEQTPLATVYEAVCEAAQTHGARVVESELVGLAPEAALLDCAARFLQLKGLGPGQELR